MQAHEARSMTGRCIRETESARVCPRVSEVGPQVSGRTSSRCAIVLLAWGRLRWDGAGCEDRLWP